jgi:LacI family transcriptional regulator
LEEDVKVNGKVSGPGAPNRRATIHDVARHANVSPATVSLVLHQKGQLTALTRERVLGAVDSVGYRPRRVTGRPRRRRLEKYCLVIDDIRNPYFHEVYRGIEDGLDLGSHVVTLVSTDDSLERQDLLLRNLAQADFDGLVIAPASGTRPEHFAELVETGIPFIIAVRNIGHGSFNYVGANPMLGMLMATEHLLRLGHKRIAFIGGNAANYAFNERYAGFVSTMKKHDLPVDDRYIVSGGTSKAFGRKAAADLLRAGDPPTAFIGYNDMVAIGAMSGIADVGLTAGKDIAVVGYDDIPEAADQPIPLTTIATPAYKLGKVIANALAGMTDNAEHGPIDITYPPTLVQRQSCGSPAGDSTTRTK